MILLIISLPAALFSWLLTLCLLVMRLVDKPRWEALLVLSVEWRPSMARYGYSTTYGRAIAYIPGNRSADGALTTRIERHEHVHIRQVEDEGLKAAIIALVVYLHSGSLVLSLSIWCSGGLFLLVHNVAAALRYGKKAYYEYAEHEKSAYAQTDIIRDGKSWENVRRNL